MIVGYSFAHLLINVGIKKIDELRVDLLDVYSGFAGDVNKHF